MNLTVFSKSSAHELIENTINQTVSCGDNIRHIRQEYDLSHYRFNLQNDSKVTFGMNGTLTNLELHVFDDEFNIKLDCQKGLQCSNDPQMFKHDDKITIPVLQAGAYLIVVGIPESTNIGMEYEFAIECADVEISKEPTETGTGGIVGWMFEGSLELVAALAFVFFVLIFVLIPILFCYFKRCCCFKRLNYGNGNVMNTPLIIKNALAVVISIGQYEYDNDTMDSDIQDGHFSDMEVEKDWKHLQGLFVQTLNYNMLPKQLKTRWTESEVITFLKDEVGAEKVNRTKMEI